jgi:hydroxymethylglutaryl-CoA lyase
MRNTHKTIAESLVTLGNFEIADKTNKEVVAYLSMGFGSVRSLECRNCRGLD